MWKDKQIIREAFHLTSLHFRVRITRGIFSKYLQTAIFYQAMEIFVGLHILISRNESADEA